MDADKRTAIAEPSEHPRPARGTPRLVIISGPELGRQIDLGPCNPRGEANDGAN